jgi:hypothetical protein
MRLNVSLKGFDEVQKAIHRLGDAKVVARVVKKSWAKSVQEVVKPRIRQHVRSRFRGKRALAASYSARVHGNRISNIRMDVYSRVDAAISHEYGPAAPIFAKGGGYLSIPTKFASGSKSRIKYKSGAISLRKINARPKARNLKKGTTFTIKGKNGGKIIMQKVDDKVHGKVMKKAFGKKGKAKGNVLPMFVLKKMIVPRRITRVRATFRSGPRNEVARRTTAALIKEYMRK